jgi:hypothetical protein
LQDEEANLSKKNGGFAENFCDLGPVCGDSALNRLALDGLLLMLQSGRIDPEGLKREECLLL